MYKKIHNIRLLISLVLIGACSGLSAQSIKEYGVAIVESYPHLTTSYTQGLQIVHGEIYEGTGMYGESRLLKVDLKSGKALKTLATLPEREFGEGITILGDTIYMLTWREGTLHMFHRETGKTIDTRSYAGEGWGLTSDGDKLYMSDGSSRITLRDRVSFRPLESHTITLEGRPIPYLNELEWIEGKIWANVYTTDQIVIIDPETWQVEAVVNLAGILPKAERTSRTDVLNGIAYCSETKKIYVTGKYWSRLFEIELVEM